MFTTFKRVFKFAVTDFFRNKGMSIAAIFVLTLTSLLATGLLFLHGFTGYLISTIQNRIDITAYFKAETPEEDILLAKEVISKLSPNIKMIEYVSSEKALAIFNEKHSDPVFTTAIEEVGGNPFLPSLNITTNGNPADYAQISAMVENSQFKDSIDKVDFSQKKDIIEKVFSITSSINKFGIGSAVLLIIIAILVVFNTLKLAIDNSKEEISTMRVVGASDWFIRWPYIFQGIFFGIFSFVITLFLTVSAVYFASPALSMMMPGFSLFGYLKDILWLFILAQILAGAGLGVASSFIVTRRYLSD